MASQVFRKCLVPTLAAVAVEVKSVSNPQGTQEERLVRPSDLPLYSSEPPAVTPPPEERGPQLKKIESFVRSTRIQLTKLNHEYNQYKKVGIQEFNKRKDGLDWLVNYLQEEENTVPKVGAIGIGALTGFIFGLRGGIIKRTVYSSLGALGIGAVCYPKEATKYGQIGVTEGKKYLMVSYNFVTGAKKEDPPVEFPSLPALPSSLTDLWESIKSTAASLNPTEKVNKVVEKVPKSE